MKKKFSRLAVIVVILGIAFIIIGAVTGESVLVLIGGLIFGSIPIVSIIAFLIMLFAAPLSKNSDTTYHNTHQPDEFEKTAKKSDKRKIDDFDEEEKEHNEYNDLFDKVMDREDALLTRLSESDMDDEYEEYENKSKPLWDKWEDDDGYGMPYLKQLDALLDESEAKYFGNKTKSTESEQLSPSATLLAPAPTIEDKVTTEDVAPAGDAVTIEEIDLPSDYVVIDEPSPVDDLDSISIEELIKRNNELVDSAIVSVKPSEDLDIPQTTPDPAFHTPSMGYKPIGKK